MIVSMTGYGNAGTEDADLSLTVEVRSVNNRYLKVHVRSPEFLTSLDARVEQLVRKNVSRGAVTVAIYCRLLGELAQPPINEDVLAGYVTELKRLAGKHGIADTLSITDVVSLPGVLSETNAAGDAGTLRDRVLSVTQAALDDFKAMRAQEGKALEADLRQHVGMIRDNLVAIQELAPTVVEEYRDRLMDRIAALLRQSPIELAQESLLTEVSIFAERSDISEEMSRLTSHLDQFDALLESKEPAGRKLEFLSQEMLREANTTGAKSGHPDIGRRIVEIKAAIDRIKEQVQNAQ
jgi:uncharacterized protein (TIGR00255 family)